MRRLCKTRVLAAALLVTCWSNWSAAQEPTGHADVARVRVTGEPGHYRFIVTLRSPDESCERYANWWEVLRPDGSLVYRRILMHSHPDEQPFTRHGGPVAVEADEIVMVRGHLHPRGYGGAVFRGSVSAGFERWDDVPVDFGANLDTSPPLPKECWH